MSTTESPPAGGAPQAAPAQAAASDGQRPYYVFRLVGDKTFEVLAKESAPGVDQAIKKVADDKFNEEQLEKGVKLWAISAREFDRSARTVQTHRRLIFKDET